MALSWLVDLPAATPTLIPTRASISPVEIGPQGMRKARAALPTGLILGLSQNWTGGTPGFCQTRRRVGATDCVTAWSKQVAGEAWPQPNP